KYIPKHRGELVAAGLTILRGYHCAGRPDQGLSVFGRFEEWSDWVRSALVWCGEADPCEGRSRIELYDPVRVTLQAVFRALLAKFGGEGVTAAQIANSGASDLLQHLLPVAGDGHGKLEVRRLGIWLAQQERRMEGGLVVERIGTRQGAVVWRVRSVTDGPGEGGAQ
ncbi:MAG: hypothetical protein GY711_29850, partial [bacterium]|nr:hypothetical protein [bacterium]